MPTCLTATGTHKPYRTTVLPATPPDRGDLIICPFKSSPQMDNARAFNTEIPVQTSPHCSSQITALILAASGALVPTAITISAAHAQAAASGRHQSIASKHHVLLLSNDRQTDGQKDTRPLHRHSPQTMRPVSNI